ncbi:MAG: glycosyltransferase [Desulfobacterales bacterium]|nr:glycosyltransferase [Desulfobacterales bacterium]
MLQASKMIWKVPKMIWKGREKTTLNISDVKKVSNKLQYNDFINQLCIARPDLEKNFIIKLLIDENEYFRKYPDVKNSGMSAIKHYISHGFYEKRDLPIPKNIPYVTIDKKDQEKCIYFSNGLKEDGAFQYEKYKDSLVFNNTSDFKQIVISIFLGNKLIYSCAEFDDMGLYVIELSKKIGVTTMLSSDDIVNNDETMGSVSSIISSVKSLVKHVSDLDLEYNKFLKDLCNARPDIGKKYISELLIDERQYFRDYPDIKKIGISAAQHYFTHGIKENRNLPIPKFLPYLVRGEEPHGTYLYFSNAPLRDGSFQYRCVFQAEKYKQSLVYNSTSDLKKIIRALFISKTIIFSRPEVSSISQYIIKLAKRIGVIVEFDYDDLLLPEYSDYLGHVRSKFSSPESANKNIIAKLPYLYLADSFRCTSPLIASHLSKLSKPVSIHQNKLPLHMSNREQDVVDKLKDINNRKINIIYLSGTATHKKDYSVIHGLLIKLAQQYPDKFTLTFLGNTQQNIDPFNLLLGEDNVKVIQRVNFQEMLKIIAKHDVGLVPLENTIFNNAKSNIKFIECGSQGTPVIASDANEFKSSIINGKTGWLCSNQSQWIDILSKIINKNVDILPVSLNAKQQVEADFMIGK